MFTTNRLLATLAGSCLLLLSFVWNNALAQPLSSNKMWSYYTYIYKLDRQQTDYLYLEHPKLDTAYFFTHLVDSFVTDSPKQPLLPAGHYLEISATRNTIQYRTFETPYFDFQTQGYNDKIWLYVRNIQGALLTNAAVKFGEEAVPYQENCACYPLPGNEVSKRVVITHQGHVTYFSLINITERNSRYSRNDPPPRGSSKKPTMLPGYMVFNQPKYNLLDTVKMKAFLVKHNGKPYRKKVRLYISPVGNNANTTYLAKIKPVSKGAYTYEMVIPDTFKLDMDYNLMIRSTKWATVKKQPFHVADYELEKTYYSACVLQPETKAGSDVALIALGQDANRLPLLDAKLKVQINATNFKKQYAKRLFIPYAWSEKFHEQELLLDVAGPTKIVLKDSLFADAHMGFHAKMEFTNTENEIHVEQVNFEYNAIPYHATMDLENGKLKGQYFSRSKPTPHKATLKAWHNSQELYTKSVTLPFEQAVETYPTQYTLHAGDTLLTSFSTTTHQLTELGWVGKKTHDSIRIFLQNEIDIPVSYRIYHDQNLVVSGRKKQVTFQQVDNSTDSWHVVYVYEWGGQMHRGERSFHIQEKELTVQINQPEEVFPGQHVPVTVKVSNYKGQPMGDVNLTAYAVNNQFPNIPKPDLPYFGKAHSNYLQPLEIQQNTPYLKNVAPIDPFYYTQLHLERFPYYRLLFGKGGIGKVADSTTTPLSMVSPYVIESGMQKKVYALWLDKDLVWVEGLSYNAPQVIKVQPGTYDLQIRTEDYLYTIPDVKLQPYQKHYIGLNIDSLEKIKAVRYVELEKPFLEEEVEAINPYLLFLTVKPSKRFYIRQDSTVFTGVSYSNNQYYHAGTKEQFQVYGPLKPGYVTLYTDATKKDTVTFYFEPGYLYELNEDSIIIKNPEDPPFFSFANMNKRSNLNQFNQFNELPMVLPSPPKPSITKATQPKKYNSRFLKNYSKQLTDAEKSSFQLTNASKEHIGKLWLFNEADSTDSRILFHYQLLTTDLKPGWYNIVAQTPDSQYVFYEHYELKPQGITYQRIDSADWQPYDSLFIDQWEQLIILLNQPKPYENLRPPLLSSLPHVSYQRSDSGKTMLAGFIRDDYGNPINQAVVLIEQHGEFRAGALTNAIGYFETAKVPAGKYSVKVITPTYRLAYYSNIVVKANQKALLDARMANVQLTYYTAQFNNDLYKEQLQKVIEGESLKASYTVNAVTAQEIQRLPARALYSIPSVSAGVFQADDGILIKGAREAETEYYVDGIKVREGDTEHLDWVDPLSYKLERSTGGIPARYGDATGGVVNIGKTYSLDYDQLGSEEMEEKMAQLKRYPMQNRMRNIFRDYAYWVPNLITDDQGEAHFTAVFPDNITSWKTFVPAMDGKKHTGLGTMLTKSYKPLSANVGLPRFLLAGDSVEIIGKTFNYLKDSVQVNTTFKLDDQVIFQKSSFAVRALIDKHTLSLDQTGDHLLAYHLKTADAYEDSEEQLLSVHPNAVTTTSGQYLYADRDTNFTLPPSEGMTKRTVYITNDQTELLFQQINALKNYEYGCNEQTASKLKALLLEKTLLAGLGKPFEEEKLLVKCMKKLEKAQLQGGAWGWWESSTANDWMTIYVADAMAKAVKTGYRTRAHLRAAEYLQPRIATMKLSDRLYCLNMLAGMGYELDYDAYIKPLERASLSLQDHFYLLQLKQSRQIDFDRDTVLKTYEKDGTGGIYWGEELLDFKVNRLATSVAAYHLLNDSIHADLMRQTRLYFLRNKQVTGNTIELATMLETFVDDIVAQSNIEKELLGSLSVNGKPTSAKYPKEMEFGPNEGLSIQKTGAPLHISIFDHKVETDPEPVDSQFVVSTAWVQDKDTVSAIKAGEWLELRVKVKAKKNSEYVMIELPIPAGCSYDDKAKGKNSHEVHREYRREKTVIFCEALPKGTHHFKVLLQPRFNGSFTVLPAEAKLMYYPTQNGRTAKTRIKIL